MTHKPKPPKRLVETSSYEKSTPPTGAPKATETPAAEATESSSRRRLSLL